MFILLVEPTEPPCKCTRHIPVGVADGRIPDQNMRSTSVKVNTHGKDYTGPSQARLNNKPSSKGAGAWVPNDIEGCLEVHFNKMEHLKEMRTQGHPTKNMYARGYFIFYSKDGKDFSTLVRVS